ncbi:hypothetical protein AHAS_Ahas05G0157000 [Arachis hypogaea]
MRAWRATPSTPSCTPSFALTFSSVGVPRLGLQVAHLSEDESLACHAFDTEWHAQVLGLSTSSMETCTGVARLDAQVACPLYGGSFKLGVPRLGLQVAHPSDGLELACHAFDTKWHTQVVVPSGLMNWRATPHGSSGTPIMGDGLGVPRPACRATPLLWLLAFLSGKL